MVEHVAASKVVSKQVSKYSTFQCEHEGSELHLS